MDIGMQPERSDGNAEPTKQCGRKSVFQNFALPLRANGNITTTPGASSPNANGRGAASEAQLPGLEEATTVVRRKALHDCMRSKCKMALSAFRLMEHTLENKRDRDDAENDVTRFDVMTNRKDQNAYPIEKVKADAFDVKGSKVLRKDKRLRADTYLTETIEPASVRWLLLPVGRFHAVWQLVIGILVFYTAVMTPIQLCFDRVSDTLPDGIVGFDVLTDLIFLADVVVNFHTAYVEDNRLILDKQQIRRHYFQRWFAIDAVGSFPGDVIAAVVALSGGGGGGGVAGELGDAAASAGAVGGEVVTSQLVALQLLKLPKMMRIGRIVRKLAERMQAVGSVFNILVLIVFVVLFNHWVCCVWYLISKGQADGWVADEGLIDQPWNRQYPVVFYTTLMMLMGDSVSLSNGGEYMLASFIVITGITLNATLFASISSYASQITAAQNAHAIQFASIQDSIRSLRLHSGLAERIFAYYRYCWNVHRDFASQKLLENLPAIFQRRCAMQAHGEMLRSFAPFGTADEHFVAQLATKLRLEVYMPEAYVLLAGQINTTAYFIARGVAQVTWSDAKSTSGHGGDTLNCVTLRDYFGEMGLFVKAELHYTVRAKTHLDTYRLDREDFTELMAIRPVSAVVVADRISTLLPERVARVVRKDIYEYVGLRKFLPTRFYRWRPPAGLAQRIANYGNLPATQNRLAKIADAANGRGGRPGTGSGSFRKSRDGGGSGLLAGNSRASQRDRSSSRKSNMSAIGEDEGSFGSSRGGDSFPRAHAEGADHDNGGGGGGGGRGGHDGGDNHGGGGRRISGGAAGGGSSSSDDAHAPRTLLQAHLQAIVDSSLAAGSDASDVHHALQELLKQHEPKPSIWPSWAGEPILAQLSARVRGPEQPGPKKPFKLKPSTKLPRKVSEERGDEAMSA